MSDRIHGFTVVLDKNYREDDIEPLRKALECFRGVIAVGPLVADPQTYASEQRAKEELREKLTDVLWPKIEVNPL